MAKDICSDKDSLCDLPAVFVASIASGPTRRPFATDGHHSHAGWGHSASSNLHEFHISTCLKRIRCCHFSIFFKIFSWLKVNANRPRRISRQLGQLSSLNNKTFTAQRVCRCFCVFLNHVLLSFCLRRSFLSVWNSDITSWSVQVDMLYDVNFAWDPDPDSCFRIFAFWGLGLWRSEWRDQTAAENALRFAGELTELWS